MKRLSIKIRWLMLTIVVCLPMIALGKRAPPKPVKPVTYDGVTYSAKVDGETEYVAATDPTSGKELW
jgi:hypothetical protein